MFEQSSYIEQISFFKKLRSFDSILLICIISIGIISIFSMYSTDGGELLHHSKSHIIRFVVFFSMMIGLSFLNIRFWHSTGYLFYIIVLGFLVWASFYGITASGSQRWISLYFINLQPSELMKIAIIICFSKYYHRIQIYNVNNFKNLLIPIVILILPIFLVKNVQHKDPCDRESQGSNRRSDWIDYKVVMINSNEEWAYFIPISVFGLFWVIKVSRFGLD